MNWDISVSCLFFFFLFAFFGGFKAPERGLKGGRRPAAEEDQTDWSLLPAASAASAAAAVARRPWQKGWTGAARAGR